MRRPFLILFLLAAPLLADADADDGKKAFLDLRLDTAGHAELTLTFEGVSGLHQFFTPAFLDGLTQPLGCRPPSVWGQTVQAFCPNQLTPNGSELSGTVRVDALFQPLYDLGVDDVIVFVHVPLAARNSTDEESTGWSQILPEGQGLRYGHRSGPRHRLPPALSVAYPARLHSNGGWTSALLAVCGIIFVPVLFAAVLASHATRLLAADSQAAIGEAALWLDLLLQFIGLLWIGLLGTFELKDLAETLLAGEPIASALFTFALVVLPTLLGTVNCLALWHPVLEKAGLAEAGSFGRTIAGRVARQASLLMPVACLSIAIRLVPRDHSGALLALGITVLLSIVLSLIGRQSILSGAHSLSCGDLYDRAQSLAQRAHTRLRFFWLLAEHVPPNAFAAPGKQIALSPALLRQLSPSQVDAVIAHELAHLRHNDFKIPVLVYTAYLTVVAPWLHSTVASFLHPAWTLVPQSLALVLLMGILSRSAEYRADRQAADLTTPEDAVRALCRIHRLARQPMTLHPLSESLVSHPSLLNRARAIAHHHQQSSEWLRKTMLDEWERGPVTEGLHQLAAQGAAQPGPLVS